MPLPVLLDFVTYTAGFLAVLAVVRGDEPWLAAFLGYPLGLFLVFAGFIAATLMGIPLSPELLWSIAAILIVGAGAAVALGGWVSRTTVVAYVVAALVSLGVSTLAGRVVLAYLPNDSMWYLVLAKVLGATGNVANVMPLFDKFSGFFISLNALARMSGADYWHSLGPELGVFLGFSFFLISARAARQFGLVGWAWPIAATLGAGIFAFALGPIKVALMVNTTLLFAVYLFVFSGLAWLGLVTGRRDYTVLAAVFLCATLPLRFEALFFAPLIAIVWSLFAVNENPRQVSVALAVPLASLLWLAYLVWFPEIPFGPNLDHLKTDAPILQNWLIIAMIVTDVAVLAFLALLRTGAGRKFAANPTVLILNACVLMLVVLVALKPGHMAVNLYAFFFHLTQDLWGGGWMVIALATLLVLAPGPSRHERFLACGVVLFVCLILAVGSARVPFGIYVSGTLMRMLFHLFPTGLFLAAICGFSLAARWRLARAHT